MLNSCKTVTRSIFLADETHAPAGCSSGGVELDQLSKGFHPGELILIAGSKGCGKTTLALQMLRHLLRRSHGSDPGPCLPSGGRAGLFCPGTSAPFLTLRLISSLAQLDWKRVCRGKLSPNEMMALSGAAKTATGLPFWIEDSRDLSFPQIKLRSRRLKRRQKIECLFIDDLQLLANCFTEPPSPLPTMLRALKSLAIELQIPIVTLIQTSSTAEQQVKATLSQESDMLFWLAQTKTRIRLEVRANTGSAAVSTLPRGRSRQQPG